MSAINVNSITGRTGTHGPVLTGITTATNGIHATGGSVGIGTDNPAAELEVYGNGRFKDADGSHGIELYPDVSGLGYQRIISYNRTTSAYENLSIGVNDFIVTNGSTSESLRITSGGNIGIGTDVPDTPLHIQGSTNSFDAITLSGGINKRKNTIGINGADNLVISVDEDAEGNSSNFRLRVDGAETLRASFDRIGIGTENDSGVGTCRVYVYNNDVPAYPVLRLENTGGTGGTGDLLHMKTGRGDGSIDADLVKLDLYDDTEIFKVDNGGTVHFRSGCGSGTFAALPVYGVRAWINFSNSGGNTTRGSGGVLTRSDDGAGEYTITFDFTMPDSDFFAIADSGNNSGGTSNRARCAAFSRTTTTASFINYDSGAGTVPSAGVDRQVNYVAFIR